MQTDEVRASPPGDGPRTQGTADKAAACVIGRQNQRQSRLCEGPRDSHVRRIDGLKIDTRSPLATGWLLWR